MKTRATTGRMEGLYLLLVFLLLAAGVVGIGFFYYRNYEQQYKAGVEQHLAAIANLKVGELVQWQKERLGGAAALHENPVFSRRVNRFLINPDDQETADLLRSWLNRLQAAYHYERVFLLDTRGDERMAVPEKAEPVAPHFADDIREALHSGNVRFLDFHRDAEGRPIRLAVLVPILDGQGGDRVIGMLVLRIDPEHYLYPFINRWPTVSRTAETLLVRRDGNDALFLNELKFQKNTALNLRIPLESRDVPAVRAILGQEGIVEGPDYRGVPVIAYVREVPDSPWFLVARMDRDEVYGPLRERLWIVIILAAALLAAAGAVIGLLWRHQRARFYQERYEAAVAMNALSERHEAILAAVPDIIMEVDERKVYAWANQPGIEFFGEDVIGREAASYFEGEQETYGVVQPLFAGEENVIYVESWQRRKDGQKRLLAWWCRVLKDQKGNVTGALSSARDITEAKQAEQDLVDSLKREQFLGRIIRNASVAVSVGYPDGKLGTCNKAFQDLTGYNEDELKTIAWNTVLTPPEWAQHEAAHLEELHRTRRSVRYEKEYVHKTGRRIPIELVVHPLFDDTGEVSHYFAFTIDITERKHAEQRIEHLNRVLRSIREVNQLIVHEKNPDRLIQEACRLLAEHQGYGSALLILTDDADVPRSFAEAGSGEVFQPLAEKLKQGELPPCCVHARFHEGVFQVTDRPTVCGPCPLAANCPSNDSMCIRLRHEEKTYGYLAVAVPFGVASDEEEVSLFAELAGDIAFALHAIELTERAKRSSAALRRSEEKYRSLVETISDVIYEIDSEGKISYVSPVVRNVLGYEPEEAIGKRFEEFVYPQDRELVQKRFEELAYGAEHLTECRLIGKSGEIRWVQTLAKPAMKKGRFAGARGALNDITERKKAEEALAESEKKFRLLYEEAPVPYQSLDEEGYLIQVNAAWLQLLGYTREEVVGKSFADFLTPWSQERFRTTFPEFKRAGHVFGIEHEMVCKDGSLIVASIDGRISRAEGGAVIRTHCVFQDITRRKQAEKALQESEQRYRATFNIASVGIDLVDRQGRFLEVNNALSQLLGYTPEELQHLTIVDVTHPEDVARSSEMHEALVQGETEGYRLEKRYVRKDGAILWVDIAVSAIRDADGQYRATVGVIRDITHARKIEEVRNRLAAAIEQAAEIVVITDEEGSIRYVNPAFEKATGYTSAEAIGRNPRILKSGEHDTVFYKHLWDTLKKGDIWSGRFINRKKDGRLYYEDATISPVKDISGKIVNFVAVKRDITEHLELAKQLQQAQKMEAVGTLAGGIAHDFNNLLQAVLGYSELVLADDDLPERFRDDLEKILAAGRNGADLVQRLLTFSRKTETRPLDLDLNQRIRQTGKFLQRTIPKMIEIELKLAEDLAAIHADPTQVDQVIMNLAVNARDAMPEGGKLLIETANVVLEEDYAKSHFEAKPGRYVLLQISDTGSGMDRNTLEHIFEPFYTTKTPGEGTGLGLAMVYGIVQQHHGFINCYSEVGHGTTFKIHLPAVVPEAQLDQPAVGAMPRGGAETILLVDDEEPIRSLGERILAKVGYTVLTACDGNEALAIYQEQQDRIALVILDLIMPEMGGRKCLEEILKIRPQAKVLIASGYSAHGPTKEAVRAEAKGFVDKPYDLRQMLRIVRDVLDEE